MVVSSTSMKLASATTMAISQGLAAAALGAAKPVGFDRGGTHSSLPRRSASEGWGLIRTVGTTDMPGPSATSVGGLSMTILTGTRWTILTQLPVAFWTGSSEKAVPDPGCMLATWP